MMLSNLLAQIVTADPRGSDGLPGIGTASGMVNGVARYALLGALAGLLVSAAIWAVGAHSQNFSQTYNGKKGVAVSAGAALIIGAATVLIDWFWKAGQGLN